MENLDKINKFNLPHRIKIAEAYSAIADDRVCLVQENCYEVLSSDYSKKYTVFVEGICYSSNDNMSYNNNILGYPIVAVLMLRGILKYNISTIYKFKNVCWNKINLEFNKNFTEALENVLGKISSNKADKMLISNEIDMAYRQIKNILNVIGHEKGKISFEESFLTESNKSPTSNA